jgi:hypothetical protein
MSATQQFAVAVEIRIDSPYIVLRCARCGTERTVVGPIREIGSVVARFADTHLDCVLPE